MKASYRGYVADSQMAMKSMKGIQQSLSLGFDTTCVAPFEPKGVVYTKRWVVELLLNLAGYTSNTNLVDAVAVEPSAGDGAFLGIMVQRLADCCERLGRPISTCRDSIIAYELDERSAESARKVVREALTSRDVDALTAERMAGVWVRSGDYLFESMAIEADFVVGNPPYVRLEDIPQETAADYRHAYQTMRGRADLYIAFYEAALRQLKAGGTCAFICADRWMRNQYGTKLRDFITSSFSVDVVIEMHAAGAFHDEVDAYPAITVIRQRKQGATVVASVDREAETVPSDILAAALIDSVESKHIVLPRGLRTAHVASWFQDGDPWACHSPSQLALLRRLEDEFLPLEATAKVGIGVATGNDSVFITKDSQLVEASRLLKLGMAKDIVNGTMHWSGHYLVDPWDKYGVVDLELYPRLREYFKKNGESLKKRHTAIKSAHAWFKTIDRVTHSLAGISKLYIADIKETLDPVLDAGLTYPHHNLYFIQSDQWNLEVLGGLLISAVGQFFVESYGVRMRGGYLRFQAQYLRRIRLPDPGAVPKHDEEQLIAAFRSRDRELATTTALSIYGVSRSELEIAVEY